MERLYGTKVATVFTFLILWTAFGSVFALLLGYSRIPYAAARDGYFFSVFARLHPTKRFPHVSLIVLGVIAIICSLMPLGFVIDALITTRILVQFIGQVFGVMLLRARRPDMPRPFRMWLYPVPALILSPEGVPAAHLRMAKHRLGVGPSSLGVMCSSWSGVHVRGLSAGAGLRCICRRLGGPHVKMKHSQPPRSRSWPGSWFIFGAPGFDQQAPPFYAPRAPTQVNIIGSRPPGGLRSARGFVSGNMQAGPCSDSLGDHRDAGHQSGRRVACCSPPSRSGEAVPDLHRYSCSTKPDVELLRR